MTSAKAERHTGYPRLVDTRQLRWGTGFIGPECDSVHKLEGLVAAM